MSFSFNIHDIPEFPFIYPPQVEQEEGEKPLGNDFPVKEHDFSLNEIDQGLANSFSIDDEFQQTLNRMLADSFPERETKSIKKTVSWSSHNQARVLKEADLGNVTVVDSLVPENQLFQFLIEQKAVKTDQPRFSRNSTHIWNEDPEEVKEIDATFNKKIRKMKDRRLIKNYHRLVSKQKHIFSKMRDAEFQSTIKKYIHRYKKEIDKRVIS